MAPISRLNDKKSRQAVKMEYGTSTSRSKLSAIAKAVKPLQRFKHMEGSITLAAIRNMN